MMADPTDRKSARPTLASQPVIWRSPRLARPQDDRDNRNARLLAYSSPEMDGLYRRLDNADLTIVLCDQNGLILGLVGASALADARDCGDEASAPTGDESPAEQLPAILQDRPASAIRVNRHGQPVADPDLLGIAAPILSPEATPQGILGILGFFPPNLLRTTNLSHPNALLQTTAEIIEHRLIQNDERGFIVLGFHPRRGVLGTPLEALAVFDRDGRLLSANRSARRLLALGESTPPEARCMDLFEGHWHSLVAQAKLCLVDPFTLYARDGTSLVARVMLR